jgi:hypothetical protein
LGDFGAWDELMAEIHKRRDLSEHAALRAGDAALCRRDRGSGR